KQVGAYPKPFELLRHARHPKVEQLVGWPRPSVLAGARVERRPCGGECVEGLFGAGKCSVGIASASSGERRLHGTLARSVPDAGKSLLGARAGRPSWWCKVEAEGERHDCSRNAERHQRAPRCAREAAKKVM